MRLPRSDWFHPGSGGVSEVVLLLSCGPHRVPTVPVEMTNEEAKQSQPGTPRAHPHLSYLPSPLSPATFFPVCFPSSLQPFLQSSLPLSLFPLVFYSSSHNTTLVLSVYPFLSPATLCPDSKGLVLSVRFPQYLLNHQLHQTSCHS